MIAGGQGELFPAGAVPAAGWLGAVLEAGVVWRRSASARLAPCPRCGGLTLHAADMALDLMTESTVDPRLLDRGLEVEALLSGRYTAELEVRRHGGGPLIFRRDRWLAAKEPNARRRLWVPQHVCNKPMGHDLPLELVFPFESRLWKLENTYGRVECPF